MTTQDPLQVQALIWPLLSHLLLSRCLILIGHSHSLKDHLHLPMNRFIFHIFNLMSEINFKVGLINR
jgi:hypothetical protein